jgi:hypothetical protein
LKSFPALTPLARSLGLTLCCLISISHLQACGLLLYFVVGLVLLVMIFCDHHHQQQQQQQLVKKDLMSAAGEEEELINPSPATSCCNPN